MSRLFLLLYLFIPITILGSLLHIAPSMQFFLAALAIIPLAKLLGDATDALASRTGPALGGLLNATFGNATELIIGIFALRAGLVEVVKASITGSIIGNLLLVTGAAIFVGGFHKKSQTFNRTAALAQASTLLLALIALVTPAIFAHTVPNADALMERLSVIVGVLMIAIYVLSILFSLRTHKHLYPVEAGEEEKKWSTRRSGILLFGATILVAWMSELLVRSIEPLVAQFGWSELFIGVIVVAVIGNAAEHTSAIMLALRNRMDAALQVSIGSAMQVALFVAPVLIFAGLIVGHPMSLLFSPFELAAIAASVFIVNVIVQDGESNWLEGAQLLATYGILAVAFFYHP